MSTEMDMDPFEGLRSIKKEWTTLEEVRHDATVFIISWLLKLSPEDRKKFASWLLSYAEVVRDDPDAEAYSIR